MLSVRSEALSQVSAVSAVISIIPFWRAHTKKQNACNFRPAAQQAPLKSQVKFTTFRLYHTLKLNQFARLFLKALND